eukprot:GEZU01043558.1.p2 GENE.GEZU01043558.1~~GEZU01043558.1.p2  ORF type:complete len:101 (+),score=1.65 GEZU01043558.1:64-366(+)
MLQQSNNTSVGDSPVIASTDESDLARLALSGSIVAGSLLALRASSALLTLPLSAPAADSESHNRLQMRWQGRELTGTTTASVHGTLLSARVELDLLLCST